MSWTDERVETLKKMWNDGQSASQIAKELGGVTRNAVIGKVHRLGLSNRTTDKDATPTEAPKAGKVEKASKPDPKSQTRVVEVAVKPRRPIIPAGQPLPPQPSANEIPEETLATAREVEKSAKRIGLMDLTERTCKWPIGDPATEDFWFCGLGAQSGKPYCEAHTQVAFQPMSSRRDRRR